MDKGIKYVQALKSSHGQHLFSKSCLKFTIQLKSNIIFTPHMELQNSKLRSWMISFVHLSQNLCRL